MSWLSFQVQRAKPGKETVLVSFTVISTRPEIFKNCPIKQHSAQWSIRMQKRSRKGQSCCAGCAAMRLNATITRSCAWSRTCVKLWAAASSEAVRAVSHIATWFSSLIWYLCLCIVYNVSAQLLIKFIDLSVSLCVLDDFVSSLINHLFTPAIKKPQSSVRASHLTVFIPQPIR